MLWLLAPRLLPSSGQRTADGRSGFGGISMASHQHEYDDIPGTFVFDAERSRKGYGINMFCMSLLKKENRETFKANEAEYLKQFHMTPEQEDAVLKRDYNRMLELGGNIYFTAKLGATDGHSFQHLAAVMTGSTQQEYASMMLGGGRNVEGNRSRTGRKTPVAAMFVDDKPKKAKPAAKKAKPAAKKAVKKSAKKAPKKAAKKSVKKSAAKSKSAKKRK